IRPAPDDVRRLGNDATSQVRFYLLKAGEDVVILVLCMAPRPCAAYAEVVSLCQPQKRWGGIFSWIPFDCDKPFCPHRPIRKPDRVAVVIRRAREIRRGRRDRIGHPTLCKM